ncbi:MULTISPECIES: hypothetical protein [unclassified Streptomyces]|uniref:hypothetical protein n=1 Tax=unclassified Streptomyces TaxID=2593676 RepID=UPI00131A2342|nr:MULTISPECIES: hypothetical protein [unclassified Streptomyces]MYT32303.1 hypothetical protein [Streptomyces sp. SID8354]
MNLRAFPRAAASALSVTSLAGAALACTAGTAVAAADGGCTGPTSKQACVKVIGEGDHAGDILFEARGDLPDAGRNCRMRLVSVDDFTGWRFHGELRRCDQPLNQEFNLPNPTVGHQYRAELQILPNGKNFTNAEFVTSPTLTYRELSRK